MMVMKGVASCLVSASGLEYILSSLNRYVKINGAPAKNKHMASLMWEYHLHAGKGLGCVG